MTTLLTYGIDITISLEDVEDRMCTLHQYQVLYLEKVLTQRYICFIHYGDLNKQICQIYFWRT